MDRLPEVTQTPSPRPRQPLFVVPEVSALKSLQGEKFESPRSAFSEKNKGRWKTQLKRETYRKTPPQKRFWTPPPMIRFPLPCRSLWTGTDQKWFWRARALHYVPPPQIARCVLPRPFAISQFSGVLQRSPRGGVSSSLRPKPSASICSVQTKRSHSQHGMSKDLLLISYKIVSVGRRIGPLRLKGLGPLRLEA